MPDLLKIDLDEIKKLTVVVGTLFVDAKGKERVQCLMSDNSIWVCDRDGTNWHPAVLPIQILTDRFHKELAAKS